MVTSFHCKVISSCCSCNNFPEDESRVLRGVWTKVSFFKQGATIKSLFFILNDVLICDYRFQQQLVDRTQPHA